MRVLGFSCALLCASLYVAAQQQISTPLQPVRIVHTDSLVHILCARTDVNFNGNLDAVDAPASWLIVDAVTRQVVRQTEFGWGNVIVQRIGIAPQESAFDIGFNDEVYRFSAATQANFDIVFTGNFSSVSSSADGKTVWLAQRPSFTDPGSIVEVDVKSRATSSFPAGINPQAPLPYSTVSGNGLAAICEGTFGGGNGTLELWTDLQGPRKRTTIAVGDTPNHLLIHGGSAYVTVNGSHKVVVVDLTTQKAIDTIFVGTSGYDGPRECVVDTAAQDGVDRIYVTTFSSDVRVFDLATGERIGTLAIGAKPEGLAIVGRSLWVTRSFTEGGYDASRNVLVFDLDVPSSVRSDATPRVPSALFTLDGTVRLPFAVDTDATITDITGRTTSISAVVSDAHTIDCRHLPRGFYALRSGSNSVTVIR